MTIGSLPATHRRDRKVAQAETKKFVKKARSAAKRGQCPSANKFLRSAFAWHGVTSAEHLGSGPKRGLPTRTMVEGAAKYVGTKCACRKVARKKSRR